MKLQSKYTLFLLAPLNAIDGYTLGDAIETTDGIKVALKGQCLWNNEDGRYDTELEDFCQKQYHMPFQSIRSLWISRLGNVSHFWCLVEMVKL
jgi:hypothetical protein